MWSSLLIKLSMLALTIGVVYWIGWTVPNTATRVTYSEVQSDPERESGLPPANVNTPGSASSVSTLAASSHPIPSGVGGRQERAKLDLNRANAQELEGLPGIGPVLAERIIEYRNSGKTFRTIDDLRAVKGIGKKKFEQIRTLVTVTPAVSQPKGGKKVA